MEKKTTSLLQLLLIPYPTWILEERRWVLQQWRQSK